MFKILFAVVLTVFSLSISWYYHDSAIACQKSQDLCFTSKLLYGCDGTRALIG